MAPSPQPNAYLNTVLNPSGGSSSSSNSNNNNNNNNNNTTTASTTTPPPRPIRTFAGAPAAQTFNATQRSLQARNKDFHVVGKREESYELRQRREEAARILESTEMLIWWSSARNQSIPQTRHHFQNIVLGIEESDADVVWREEWEVEDRERNAVGSPRSSKGKEREKRRVSSGLHA